VDGSPGRFDGGGVRWALSGLLPQPILQRFPVQQNSFAGVPQVTMSPELVHVVGDDLARCAHVLRKQLVGERHHLYPAVLRFLPQTFGEADQRARQTPRDIVHRETLDPVTELDRSPD